MKALDREIQELEQDSQVLDEAELKERENF